MADAAPSSANGTTFLSACEKLICLHAAEETAPPSTTLYALPDELVFYIFSFLSTQELCSAAEVPLSILSPSTVGIACIYSSEMAFLVQVSTRCRAIVNVARFLVTGQAGGPTWKEQYLNASQKMKEVRDADRSLRE